MAVSRDSKYTGTQRGIAGQIIEEEAGAAPALDRDGGGHPKFNVQQFSGIAFFAALQYYQEKDVAMAFAICLEAALYWRYEARPGEKESKVIQAGTHDPVAGPSCVGKRKASSELANSAQATKSEEPSETANINGGKKVVSKKRQKTQSDKADVQAEEAKDAESELSDGEAVFQPANLKPNMAVLLRTEPDGSAWNKCWSMGRVTKAPGTAKKGISVCWLKPAAGSRALSVDKLFAQKWVPWIFGQGRSRLEWTSDNVDLKSVQYGVRIGSDGHFSKADQSILSSEVKRLEASAGKQTSGSGRRKSR